MSWSTRGWATCSSRCAPGYLVRDLAVDLGYPVVVTPGPSLGLMVALLTVVSARARSLDVACHRPQPLAKNYNQIEAVQPARRSPTWPAVRRQHSPTLDLNDPSS